MKTPTKPVHTLKILLISSMSMLWVGMTNIVLAAENRPHQHGEGELNIALDDHDLVLEVRLPAADVVGFESSPKDDEQIRKVEQALASFKTATAWFEPAEQAQCALERVQASLVGMSVDSDENAADSAGKSSSAHSHEHKHDHDHKDQHADSRQPEKAHSDFEGFMQFHCDAPDKLDALAVLLFKSFPGITELRVQMVTSTSQISRSLTPDAAVLPINP